MLSQLIDLLSQPEAYVAEFRDGELYIEPVRGDVVTGA